MPIFDLDEDYTASFIPYRYGSSYVAKGTIFRRGKPVKIFEAHGLTLPSATGAALAEAKEIHRRLKARMKKRAVKKC